MLWLLVLTVFVGEATIIAGWWTAEIGRQPWVVYDVLMTADGVSPVLTAIDVVLSLGMFVVLYALLLVLFLYLLNRKIQAGPGGARGGRDGRRRRACRTRSATSSADSRPRRRRGRRAMTLDDVWFVLFVLIIAGYLILDGFDMGVGILLPAARPDRRRATHVPQQHRPGLGRQRGLAGARRRRPVRGLPARLRLAVLGLLPRVHARPAGADPAHGRDRVPVARRSRPRWRSTWDAVFAAASLGLALLLGVAFGNIVTGAAGRRRRQHLEPA